MPKVAAMSSGERTLGRTRWPRMRRVRLPTARDASTNGSSRMASAVPRTSRVRPNTNTIVRARMTFSRARAEDAGHGEREHEGREAETAVGDPHQHVVDRPAGVAGEQSDEEGDRHRDRDHRDAHDERHPGAVDDAAEEVAPEVVGAQPVAPRTGSPAGWGCPARSGSYGATHLANSALNPRTTRYTSAIVGPGRRSSRRKAPLRFGQRGELDRGLDRLVGRDRDVLRVVEDLVGAFDRHAATRTFGLSIA